MKKIGLLLFIIVFCLACSSDVYTNSLHNPHNTQEISNYIYSTSEFNEVAFDSKYKNHIFYMIGVPDKVMASGEVVFEHNFQWKLICKFNDLNKLANLRKNTEILFSGEYNHVKRMHHVYFENCQILQITGD